MRTESLVALVLLLLSLVGLGSGCATHRASQASICSVPGTVPLAFAASDLDRVRTAEPGSDDEDGMSGSGYSSPAGADEDGLSGTGIRGTLTGFGSVCVNGRRVAYDERVAVRVDGQPAGLHALRIGQVLSIDSAEVGEHVRARALEVQHEIVGPITWQGGGSIEVMNQRVDAVEAALGGQLELAVGTRVAVSGLRRADAVIVASRIDAALDSQSDAVRGLLREVKGRSFVGAVSILSPENPTTLEAERGSLRVFIEGVWDAGRAVLEETARQPSRDVSPQHPEVDIEGYVLRVEGDAVQVGDLMIEASDLQTARMIGSLQVDERIRIRARRAKAGDGVLKATRVQRVLASALLKGLRAAEVGAGPGRALGKGQGSKDKSEHPVHPTHPEHPAQASNANSNRPERASLPARPVRPERAERPSRPERPEKRARPDLPDIGRPPLDRSPGQGRGRGNGGGN